MAKRKLLTVILLVFVLATLTAPAGSSAPPAPAAAPAALSHKAYLPRVDYNRPVLPIYLGATVQPTTAAYDQDLTAFENAVGRRHGIYNYYINWGADWLINQQMISIIANHGATPMVTWMSVPNTGSNPQGCGDSQWNLDSINNGSHDATIRSFAQSVAAIPHTILLRWGHEMNLVEYSWAGYCNGANQTAPVKFIAAFRRIHDIFRQVGATNVKFIWSPNFASYPNDAWNNMNNYYPGDAYVDWIGIVGYNWGQSNHNSLRWVPFTDLFDQPLRDQYARHPTKPLMIADYASAENDGGDKATWITDAFHAMLNYPNLQAAIWFDWKVEVDFRVNSSLNSLNAYRNAITLPRLVPVRPYP